MRETSSQIESRKVVSLGDIVMHDHLCSTSMLGGDSSRSLILASLRPLRNDEPGQIILPPMGRNGSMQGLLSCIRWYKRARRLLPHPKVLAISS